MRRQFTQRLWRNVYLIVAALGWAQMAAAQQQKADGMEAMVLRTYEVGDLIVDIHDYPYSDSLQRKQTVPGGAGTGGGFGGGAGGFGGGGGGGLFSVPDGDSASNLRGPRSARDGATFRLCQFGGGGAANAADTAPGGITIDNLIDAIESTVAPKTWADNGGGDANIRPIGTVLVILQTPSMHDRIRDLLVQIRAASGSRKTLTIDARWVLLTSDDLDKLLLPNQHEVPEVDPKRLAEFTRRPGSIRGITTCFSGQLVYLVSGTRPNVVSGYIPVVGSIDTPDRAEHLVAQRRASLIRLVSDTSANSFVRDAHVGYQPTVEKPNLGALLEIRPTLTDRTAVVDLKSTITALGQQQLPPSVDAQSADVPVVDRFAVETQEFATTLRVPLGKPVLVGGLTYVPPSQGAKPDGQQQPAGEKPQLYLVLEVN